MLIKGFSMLFDQAILRVQFHAASLSNFSQKQGIAFATKAGGGKHKIQINGICLANRTSFSMCTKTWDICSLCGPEARVYCMSISAGKRVFLLLWLSLLKKLGEHEIKSDHKRVRGYRIKVSYWPKLEMFTHLPGPNLLSALHFSFFLTHIV